MQPRLLNRAGHRAAQHQLRTISRSFTATLEPVPRSDWPASALAMSVAPLNVWRSSSFLVCEYPDPNGYMRLSIQRSAVRNDGHWQDGIMWDEMQALKKQCGYGDRWAVEVFPPEAELVNVANIRHLWLLPSAPTFAWIGQGGR